MEHALPKGPRSALIELVRMRDTFAYMVELANEYEDPLTCPLVGQDPLVITWSPEGAKAIYTADPDTFEPGAADALAVIVGSGSIFLKSGADHKRARKLLAPPFHGDRMRAYGELIHRSALRWARERPRDVSVPILETAQGITLDVIIEAIFGERDEAKVRALHRQILDVVGAFNPLIAGFRFMQRNFGGIGPWAKFKRRADALQATMRELIANKRAHAGEDILSLLLSVKDEDGNGLPEQELMDQLLSFVVAGHETTAASLAWAMYELHRSPESFEKLRRELGSLGPAPSPEAIVKLPYLEAVCNEALRRHPPVPVLPRRLVRDFTLGKHTLPAGTRVGVCIYLAHHRPETFEDPFTFRPERFIGRTYTAFELMPFGGGARRCLGAAFATFELKIALAAMLSVGEYRLDEPKPVKSVFRIGTYGPEHGVRMTSCAPQNGA